MAHGPRRSGARGSGQVTVSQSFLSLHLSECSYSMAMMYLAEVYVRTTAIWVGGPR